MPILAFLKSIFTRRPWTIIAVSALYFVSGVLELFSMAMLYPVLLGLMDSQSEAGAAAAFLSAIKLEDINLVQALVGIAALMSVRGGMMYFADLQVAKMARNLEAETRLELFDSFLSARWPHLQKQNLGELPNVILRETERYAISILYLGKMISAGLIASVLVASSVFASWELCALFVLAVLPYLLVSKMVSRQIAKHAKKRIATGNDLSAQLAESLLHLKYIKSSAIAPEIYEQASKPINGYANHSYKSTSYSLIISYFPEVFGVVIIAGLITIAKNYIGVESADIIFFLLLIFRGYRQIANVQKIIATLIDNIPSYHYCKEVIGKAKSQEEDMRLAAPTDICIDAIRFDNISFSYQSQQDEKTLSDIRLTLPKTGLVVLAGASGAGKSTLIDLLLGLLPPQSGHIYLNQTTALSDVNLQAWRHKVGYVPQEPFLVAGTIKENILLHCAEHNDEHLAHIASLAKVDDFVDALPEGYNTHLGLINTGVSGGQKQRIALARALANDPLMLILDEATSALDRDTAASILGTIKAISQDKLVVMIAHSVEAIKIADIVCIMENGRIIQTGSYEDLQQTKDGTVHRYIASSDNNLKG